MANEGNKNLVAFISFKISGKPGMKISRSVKAKLTMPKGGFCNNYFPNIRKKYQSVLFKNTVALKQNAVSGNCDQGIGINCFRYQ